MKNIEIERKFLLIPCSIKRFLKKNGIDYQIEKIEQFYIQSSENGVERYRQKGDKYIHTIKKGSGLIREEYEEFVDKNIYLTSRKSASNIIKKSRYIFKIDGNEFELDEFEGDLKGLNILEIEFKDKKSAENFTLPNIFRDIVISEVTEDIRFSNGYLSKEMTIPTIESDILNIFKEIEKVDHKKAIVILPIDIFISGESALKIMIYALVLSIETNAIAIINGDNDPERLHQLRVAMRKIRAIFTQLQPLFDSDWSSKRKKNISYLMKKTNNKRDLDVYLIELNNYKKLIEKKYHKGLERLGKYISKTLLKENQQIIDMLNSEEFKSEISNLKYFALSDSEDAFTKDTQKPIILFVKKAIKRRYKKIVKSGIKIDKNSPPSAYHQLRIEVKKLRYMMEFFSSILQKSSYKKILPKLKTIQDILGEYQDLQVQSEHLDNFVKRTDIDDKSVMESVRILQKEMLKKASKKRSEFREEFLAFANLEYDIKETICRF